MAFLSQAPPLGGLLPPHGAFQEHAAHPPRWPGELSSKGSSDTCISDGVFHIPMPCFHGAQWVGSGRVTLRHVSPIHPLDPYVSISSLSALLSPLLLIPSRLSSVQGIGIKAECCRWRVSPCPFHALWLPNHSRG